MQTPPRGGSFGVSGLLASGCSLLPSSAYPLPLQPLPIQRALSPRTNPPSARADWVGLSRQMPAPHPQFVLLLAACCYLLVVLLAANCSPLVGSASLRSAVRFARCACSFFASFHRCAFISRFPSLRPLSATPALALGLLTPYVCPLADAQSPRASRGGALFIISVHAGFSPLHSYARASRSLRAKCHVNMTKPQKTHHQNVKL